MKKSIIGMCMVFLVCLASAASLDFSTPASGAAYNAEDQLIIRWSTDLRGEVKLKCGYECKDNDIYWKTPGDSSSMVWTEIGQTRASLQSYLWQVPLLQTTDSTFCLIIHEAGAASPISDTVRIVVKQQNPDVHEPNNLALQATPLTIGGSIVHGILPGGQNQDYGDQDYFSFKAAAGQRILLKVDMKSQNFRTWERPNLCISQLRNGMEQSVGYGEGGEIILNASQSGEYLLRIGGMAVGKYELSTKTLGKQSLAFTHPLDDLVFASEEQLIVRWSTDLTGEVKLRCGYECKDNEMYYKTPGDSSSIYWTEIGQTRASLQSYLWQVPLLQATDSTFCLVIYEAGAASPISDTVRIIVKQDDPDVNEPNNLALQATPLTIGGGVVHGILPGGRNQNYGDQDYYGFKADAGQRILLKVDMKSQNFRTWERPNLCVSQLRNGMEQSVGYGEGGEIILNASQSGDYLLRIGGMAVGEYELSSKTLGKQNLALTYPPDDSVFASEEQLIIRWSTDLKGEVKLKCGYESKDNDMYWKTPGDSGSICWMEIGQTRASLESYLWQVPLLQATDSTFCLIIYEAGAASPISDTVRIVVKQENPDLNEPNNMALKATSLSIGGSVVHGIMPGGQNQNYGDQDYFSFMADAGQRILLKVDMKSQNFRTWERPNLCISQLRNGMEQSVGYGEGGEIILNASQSGEYLLRIGGMAVGRYELRALDLYKQDVAHAQTKTNIAFFTLDSLEDTSVAISERPVGVTPDGDIGVKALDIEPSQEIQNTMKVAELVIYYGDKDIGGLDEDSLKIHHFNEQTREWELVGGKVDKVKKTVTVDVEHFSTYGVFAKATAATRRSTRQNLPAQFGFKAMTGCHGIDFLVGIEKTSSFTVTLHDALGRELVRHTQKSAAPGYHRVNWHAVAKATRPGRGVYFATLQRADRRISRKVLMLR